MLTADPSVLLAPTAAAHHTVATHNHTIYCPHCGKVAATMNSSAMLSMPINDYRWPQRIRNAFRTRIEWLNSYERVHAPIETFGELCALSRDDLLDTPFLGVGSVKTIEQVLASYGLKLRDGAG